MKRFTWKMILLTTALISAMTLGAACGQKEEAGIANPWTETTDLEEAMKG